MAATLFDNWVFLLLVAVAMLFRWLMSAANKASKDSSETDESSTPSPPPIPRPPAQTDEERIRKFLEALGQPPGSKPPPRVERRQMDVERAAREARQRVEQAKRATEQKKKIFVPRPGIPPLATVPPPLPVESPAATEPQAATEEGPPPERLATLEPAIFEVQDTGLAAPRAARVPTTPVASNTITALVRSPSGLRNAIILREVLGPPRSLQPLELV